MSAETLDPQVEEAGIPDEGPSTLPFEAPSVEVGLADPDPHEIARAEDDGLGGAPSHPVERTTAEKLHDAEIAAQIEEATAEVCQAQLELEQAVVEEDRKAREKKAATQAVEAKREWLSEASCRLRKLRAGRFPDGDKYPLLDKPAEGKAEINEQFSKPEAVAPLPADDIAEHFRRCKRDTPLDSLGLTPKVIEILAGAGFKMVIDLDQLEGRDLATIKSDAGTITEKRAEQVRDAIEAAAEGWMAAWYDAHPGATT